MILSEGTRYVPVSNILKKIIYTSGNSKTIDPHPKTPLFSTCLHIFCHHHSV